MLPGFLHFLTATVWPAFLVVLFFGGSIFVHELGHFLAARRRGVHVERFSIGFGPAIWSHRARDGVEYRLAWFPLGGYVLLPQLADLGAVEGASAAGAAELPPVGYASRMIVFVAGAAFNVLFAFALACIIWTIGQPESAETATTRIGYVSPTIDMPDGSKVPSPASQAGLRPGDQVVAIDGHRVADWIDLTQTLNTGAGRDGNGRPKAVFTLVRDGRTMDVVLLPRLAGDERIRRVGILPAYDLVVYQAAAGSPAQKAGFAAGDRIVSLDGVPMLNAVALGERLDAARARAVSAKVVRGGREITLDIAPRPAAKAGADFGLAFSIAVLMSHPSPFSQIWDQVAVTFRTLWSLLNPHSDVGLSKLTGPVGIVRILDSAAEAGIRSVLMFTILVNVNLAIFNLLPIPVLDGGQMLFATIGKLRGRVLPVNFISAAQSVFIVLLFSMILYVSYFDVRRWARDASAEKESAAAPAKP
jgi:regulator of sigma E protease